MSLDYVLNDCVRLLPYQPHFADYLGRLERYTGLTVVKTDISALTGKHASDYNRLTKQVSQLLLIDGLGMRLYTKTLVNADGPCRSVWLIVDGYFVELTPGNTSEIEKVLPVLWQQLKGTVGEMCGHAMSVALRSYVKQMPMAA